MDEFQPIPQVTLFFPCKEAAVNMAPTSTDLQLGWWEIKRPMYHVYMERGKKKGFGVNILFLYYQISSGRGDYHLTAEYRPVDLANRREPYTLMRTDPFRVHFENELTVVEDAVTFRKAPFPRPGMYIFTLRWNGTILPNGECYLRVFEGADL